MKILKRFASIRHHLVYLSVIALVIAGPLAAEEIRLTTYYPSPYGEYDGLEANDLTINGGDLDFIQGDTSLIHSIGSISFDWTAGTYDSPANHGIRSYNEAGNLGDELSINSFNDIITRIDSNNNDATSYFKVEHHSTGNGADLFWTSSPNGDGYFLGNVGIGDTTPIEGRIVTVGSNDLPGVYLTGEDNIWFDAGQVRITTHDGFGNWQIKTGADNDDVYIGAGNGAIKLRMDENGLFQIYTAPAGTLGNGITWNTGIVQDSAGEVGIGTTAPSEKLHVVGKIYAKGDIEADTAFMGTGGHGTSYAHFSHPSLTASGQYALLQHSGGTTYLNAPTGTGINFRIQNVTKGTLEADGDWAFDTNTLFVDESANRVGIGNTAPSGTLHVTGDMYVSALPANPLGALYMRYVTSTGVVGYITSTIRHKQNIKDLAVDEEKVLSLRPRSFEYKKAFGGGASIGLIAEEVEKVIPEMVVYDKDGLPEGVNYDYVPIYLLSIVKDLKEEVKSLKQEVAELKQGR